MIMIYPLGTINVSPEFHRNPFDSCWVILVQSRVICQQIDIAHTAMSLDVKHIAIIYYLGYIDKFSISILSS